MNRKLISMTAAGLALGLGLAGSSYAADLDNATVASIKQGKTLPNGSTCLYLNVFIPSEAAVPFLKYTLAVSSKAGDLVSAMIVTGHRTINFDFGPANAQCQELDGFAGVPSIAQPGAP
jgi:hypothetical protein